MDAAVNRVQGTDPRAAADTARQAQEQSSAPVASKATPAATSTSSNASGSGSPLSGVSFIAANAVLSSGRNLITSYVIGPNNQVAQIRVINPETHQVVAESPPETLAQIEQEMAAYQDLGKQPPSSGA